MRCSDEWRGKMKTSRGFPCLLGLGFQCWRCCSGRGRADGAEGKVAGDGSAREPPLPHDSSLSIFHVPGLITIPGVGRNGRLLRFAGPPGLAVGVECSAARPCGWPRVSVVRYSSVHPGGLSPFMAAPAFPLPSEAVACVCEQQLANDTMVARFVAYRCISPGILLGRHHGHLWRTRTTCQLDNHRNLAGTGIFSMNDEHDSDHGRGGNEHDSAPLTLRPLHRLRDASYPSLVHIASRMGRGQKTTTSLSTSRRVASISPAPLPNSILFLSISLPTLPLSHTAAAGLQVHSNRT